MQRSAVLTASDDEKIREMREKGLSLDAVAAVLGSNRSAITRRANAVGLYASGQDEHGNDITDDRQPLPPGHPTSWQCINIDGAAYPDSVPL